MKTVGFIGAGNMASAIIRGIFNSNNSDIALISYDVNTEKVNELKKYNVKCANSVKELCKKADYIFLAVKPQSFNDILSEIRGNVDTNKIIVTIAAGITSNFICKAICLDTKTIRVMPNTPLMINYGASALCHNDLVTNDEFNFVRDIFNSAGITEEITEDKMNEIIAVNGSTPAYIYLYAKYFVDYGKSVGLDESVCKDLFSQTLIGSAKMITDSGKTIDELIEQVSSKGGTTIAGLGKLYDNNLQKAVNDCCDATIKRAQELSK